MATNRVLNNLGRCCTDARAMAMCVGLVAFAQVSPAASHSGAGSPSSAKSSDVEVRITTLHRQLGITSDEESGWRELSDVMRDNAQQMHEAVELRQQSKNLSAIDDLKGYQIVANAHSRALEKLIPAFQKFYETLSDSQKTKADVIFAHSRHRT